MIHSGRNRKQRLTPRSCFYLLHEAPSEDQNMETILYMIENGGAKEEDDDYQSPLDLLFEALEEEQPDHIAVRQYHIFQASRGQNCKIDLGECRCPPCIIHFA